MKALLDKLRSFEQRGGEVPQVQQSDKRERPGCTKVSIFSKIPFKKQRFRLPGLAGSGRDGEKYRFSLKFLLKSHDFDCPGWPGAAGMEKSVDF